MRTSLLLFFVILLSLSSHSNASQMELPAGLWEGISEDELTFRLLQINENGEHSLFEIVIPGGLKKVRRTTFTNNDITCVENRCTIKTIIKDDVTRTLTLSPYLDRGFKVLESSYREEESYISQTYLLVKQDATSTPRKFLENRKQLILDAEQSSAKHPFGTWIGVMQYLDRPELALLQLNENEPGSLRVYRKGENTFNEVESHFSADNISIDGRLIDIKASHTTFASNIMLFIQTENMISGFTYALHKGYPAAMGTITLLRIEPAKPR
ncbi:hypothetical protein [Alteromonas sp. KUL106]|uniref:hypothetical protein n=1 Tax=Alteromonas sp. KUL106 TaxID=2480799 RepID=UPI0012E4CDDC|nr:hypothetical protein [Alteromonas sp. KUL106]GFD69868.1 hypothetical protein KUL106_31310 [Alteromonas sp. KUL106]